MTISVSFSKCLRATIEIFNIAPLLGFNCYRAGFIVTFDYYNDCGENKNIIGKAA